MASIQGIYIALFGRPADPAGLAYFNGLTKNGADLSGIGNLAGQKEYTDRFVGMTNSQIVNSIYQSLFGRDAEQAGVDFFVSKLAAGQLTINNVAIAILDGAQGTDKATADAKIAAANLFTSHLDLASEQAAYNGATSIGLAHTFLGTVDATHPGTAADADAAILRMVQSAGQAPGGGQEPGDGGTPTPTLAERGAAIIAEWHALDQSYITNGPNNPVTNEGFTRLGVTYIEYLKDGGAPLDGTAKGDGIARDQSFHDNLLGNVTEAALQQRYAGDPVLKAELHDLIAGADAKFLDRPYEDGTPPNNFSASDAWDLLNHVNRPDLDKTDVDLSTHVWEVDRAAPQLVTQTVADGHITDVTFNINESGAKGDSDFARYQGVKLADGNSGAYYNLHTGAVVSADFKIDASWTGDNKGESSGIWIQMQNSDPAHHVGGGGDFSIAEYVDADAAAALGVAGFTGGFRFYNSADGWAKYVNFDKPGGGEVNLSFAFTDEAHVWFVDGKELYRDTGASVAEVNVIETAIFNSRNYGDDADYTYSNVSLTGVTEHHPVPVV